MNIAEEMEKLNKYKESGVMSESEFRAARDKLLNEGKSKNDNEVIGEFESFGHDEKSWCATIHFSQLASFFFPPMGFIIPIILWQINKDKSELIDINGRIVANWILTSVLGYAIFGILCFFLIGIPFVLLILVLGTFFPILGGTAALRGEIWKYPLSISFIPINWENTKNSNEV